MPPYFTYCNTCQRKVMLEDDNVTCSECGNDVHEGCDLCTNCNLCGGCDDTNEEENEEEE